MNKKLATIILAVLLALPGTWPARAEDYPIRPIHMIVGYPAGGATDYAARVLADALSTGLKQTVVVENRPGAASAIAVEFVSRAKPDGYTLLYGNADGLTILPAVKPTVPFKIPESLTFISRTVQFPLAFGISAKLPMKTMQDFVAYAKANPRKVRYGSSGLGGALHIEAVLMAQAAGIEMTHVPYKGAAAAATDLAGGFIEAIFLPVKDISPYVQDGTVRLLAVSSATRDPTIPDVPTLQEAGLGAATMADWFGVMGPPNLPPAISATLEKAIADALEQPEPKRRLASTGLYNAILAGSAFQTFVVDEYRSYKTVADQQHILITD